MLQYRVTMPAASSAKSANPRDERGTVRLDVRMKGSLREHGHSSFSVDVVDLSASGCRLDTSCLIEPGTRVWLKFPRLGALVTTVMWRDGFRYGCSFDQPLHMAVFDHIVKRHRRAD